MVQDTAEATPTVLSAEEFRKWVKEDRARNAKRNMRGWGFNIFIVGLAVLSLALALLQTVELREIDYLELISISITSMIVGVMFIFLSPWAADKDEGS